MEIENYVGYKIPVETVDSHLLATPAPPVKMKRKQSGDAGYMSKKRGKHSSVSRRKHR